jgi:hypothetical protein
MTRTTTTDADGRFAFVKLPAGEYTLSATKPGYLESVYGARRPGATSPGTPIRLAAGQKIDDVSFRLPRGGVISGVVTDEFGDPAFSVPVRAMRFTYTNGERVAYPAGNVVTNDLGEYRVAGLLPGEYVVTAVPRDIVAMAAGAAESLQKRLTEMAGAARAAGQHATIASMEEAKREGRATGTEMPSATGYVPAYHPGAALPSAAEIVRVGVSQHVAGIDIQLQVLQTSVVSGVVTNTEGAPTAGQVQLVDPSMPIANLGVWFRQAQADGKFAFRGVVPGAYVVRAQANAAGGGTTAEANVAVAEGSTNEVTLGLRRGVTVSGSVDLATLTVPVDLKRVRVDLLAIPTSADWEFPLMRATPDAAGKFVLRGVAPGRYRVAVGGLPEGWTLASAVFGETDAADHNLHVEIGGKYADGVLKLTSRTSEIAGTVTNASGDPVRDHTVVIFPSARSHWVPQSRRIHLAQPDRDGHYTIRGLPSGEYRVVAVDDVESGRQFDPEFLGQLVAAATTIMLGEGERRSENIRLK